MYLNILNEHFVFCKLLDGTEILENSVSNA